MQWRSATGTTQAPPKDPKNPTAVADIPTAVAVGALFRVADDRRTYRPWKVAFTEMLQDTLKKDVIRFLVGVLDCDHKQLESLLRSCGASYIHPLAQCFWKRGQVDGDFWTDMVFHPNMIISFGPAELRVCPPDLQPEMPEWLEQCGFARWARPMDQVPTWRRISDWKKLPQLREHLGRVVLKQTDIAFWRPHIHSLKIWIQSRRRACGAGAARKKPRRRRTRRGRSGRLSSQSVSN